jgi:hypothetical protein
MIQIANFNPPGRGVLSCVLGDAVDLTPFDQRFTYSYAVVAHPGGSSAAFSGAAITPDVAGAYTLSVSTGTETLSVPVFVFAASVYNGLAPSTVPAYGDAEKRAILAAVANGGLNAAGLATWNAGTWPALNFRQFGGR